MALFKVCFDESGDSLKHTFFSMAGVLATKRQWRSLYAAWRKELKRGRPIGSFHMYEAVTLSGEFSKDAGWSKHLVAEKVAALTKVVRDNSTAHLIVLMPLPDFRRIMNMSESLPDEYKDPYLYCFVQSLISVAIALDHIGGPQRPPELVYDRQKPAHKRFCEQQYEYERLHGPKELRRCLSEDGFSQSNRKDEIGIQAADLVAWHYRTGALEKYLRVRRQRPFIGLVKNHLAIGPPVDPSMRVELFNRWRLRLHEILESDIDEKRTRLSAKRAAYAAIIAKNKAKA